MKAFRIIPVLVAALIITSCSSNKRMAYDDTYYSPYNKTKANTGTVSPSISSSSSYDYQAYYSNSKNFEPNVDPVYQTTETVTDTNGVVYTTTETYYDADFAARIKRFGTGASSTMDYYDDYYTSSSDGGNTYVYVGDSWNWGFYPYRPYYYDYYYYYPSYYYSWYFYDYYWYRPYYWYSYHWGWYDHYWYHPHHHHHHHHHDHFGHGGGSGFNNGGGHNDFSSYVASVRRNNSTPD